MEDLLVEHRAVNSGSNPSGITNPNLFLSLHTAIALLRGMLTAEDYEDEAAADPRVDQLRDKMTMQHDRRFTEDYIDPDKRSIANAVQVRFKDGSSTENITVEYPIGHRRRRQAAKPLLVDKFRANLSTQLDEVRVGGLVNLFSDQSTLGLMAVDELIDMLVLTVD